MPPLTNGWKWLTGIRASRTCPWLTQSWRLEALQVAEIAKKNGWKKIILVTSAYHMKRAEGTFKKVGLEIIPFACDFHEGAILKHSPRLRLWPNGAGIASFQKYSHEILGYMM